MDQDFYVIKTKCSTIERKQLKDALKKELYKDAIHRCKENKKFLKQIFELKIQRSDWSNHPEASQIKKGDITFCSFWDIAEILNSLTRQLPHIDWECELWREWIGLSYVYYKKNDEHKQWPIEPDDNDLYDYPASKEWDDYFSNPLY